ncbi:major Facilitator Superfamily protein, partial [Vibrio parahaemolyticus V-223/04]
LWLCSALALCHGQQAASRQCLFFYF